MEMPEDLNKPVDTKEWDETSRFALHMIGVNLRKENISWDELIEGRKQEIIIWNKTITLADLADRELRPLILTAQTFMQEISRAQLASLYGLLHHTKYFPSWAEAIARDRVRIADPELDLELDEAELSRPGYYEEGL